MTIARQEREEEKKGKKEGKVYYAGNPELGRPGRPTMKLDSYTEELLFDMLETGLPKEDIRKELDISYPVLNRFISQMQDKSPILLEYRSIQSLQLTELQYKILEAITPEKIEEASLKDLVLSYKILKEKEQLLEGKPGEIKGLISYLVEIEKRDVALANRLENDILEEVKNNPDSLSSQLDSLESLDSSSFIDDSVSEWELKTGRTVPILPTK